MRFLLAVCFALFSTALFAQTPTPLVHNRVTFPASTSHSATALDGTPLVSAYELNATAMNAVGAIALTVGLGKPTPNANNVIVVVVAQLATITQNVTYTARITTTGPGGSAVSPDSNPFGVIVVSPPAAVASVSVE